MTLFLTLAIMFLIVYTIGHIITDPRVKNWALYQQMKRELRELIDRVEGRSDGPVGPTGGWR